MRSEILSRRSSAWRVALLLFILAVAPAAATEYLLVTPGDGYRPVGDPGGPFAPSTVYTMTNRSSLPINWQATTTTPWLTLTPPSGTIAAGGQATVTVSVNATANTFSPGRYSGSFTLQGAGESRARSAVLTVRGTWTQLTGAAPWGAREGFGSASFQKKLWVIGGKNAAGQALADVWSSPDGINWTSETLSPAWSARSGHRVIVYQNKLWLLGGGTPQVWNSPNGRDWTQVTTAAPWGNRTDFAITLFQDKIYVAGGLQDGFPTNDVWYTTNGSAWTQVNASAQWSARSGSLLTVDPAKNYLLTLLGGRSSTTVFSQAWRPHFITSYHWYEFPWLALPAPRAGMSTAFYGNITWVMGGTDGTNVANTAWNTNYTISTQYPVWWNAPETPTWPGRTDFAAQVLGSQLFVMGGRGASGPLADVWALNAPWKSALTNLPKLTVDPVAGFAASGPMGGPFTPASKTYTIQNTGSSPLNWQVSMPGVAWLTLSKTGGTALAPGGIDTVTITINASANTLAPRYGGYTGILQFKNLSTNQGHTQVGVKLTVAGTPAHIQVTPAAGFRPSGAPGGPFTPQSQIYTISNPGDAPVNWQIVKTGASWLDLSKASGTLAAHISETVTASVNASANALLPKGAAYTGSLQFKNMTNNYGNLTVGLALNVTGNPPRLAVNPPSGFQASGPYGGPFTPTQKTYVITNTGGLPLNWNAVLVDADWTTLSKTSDTLNPGTSDTVTLSLSALVNSKLPRNGGHTGILKFNNLTNGSGSLQVGLMLNVSGTPPQMTVSPLEKFQNYGAYGGPFPNPSKVYTITNTGGLPIQWEVVPNVTWLTPDVPSGTLAPGASQQVTFSLNEVANTLAGIHRYGGVINFKNLSNGAGNAFVGVEVFITTAQ